MKIRLPLLASLLALSGLGVASAQTVNWEGGTGISGFRFERHSDGQLHPERSRREAPEPPPQRVIPAPVSPAPSKPPPAPPQISERERAFESWSAQGWAAMNRNDWAGAERCLLKALENGDDEHIRAGLLNAQTFRAYEKYLKDTEEQKGQTLTGMASSLNALSQALAAVRSMVATNRMARNVEAGSGEEVSAESLLSDASVVDLRHVTAGMVALDKLQSPYVRAPQPVLPASTGHLSDQQTAGIANLFLYYQMGYSPSEREIEELLGMPTVEHMAPASGPLQGEREQMDAALSRFSTRLVQGCNEALYQTSQELERDPVTTKVRAMAALEGAEHINPAIRALWEQRNQEAQQRLFARFRIVQDMAMRNLGIECTLIFKQAGGPPRGAGGRGREAGEPVREAGGPVREAGGQAGAGDEQPREAGR